MCHKMVSHIMSNCAHSLRFKMLCMSYCRQDRTDGMTSRAGKPSRRERHSVSESSHDSVASADEDDKSPTSTTSNVSSSDVTDLSGYALNVDVESDESLLAVPKRLRRGVAATGTACWHESANQDDTHTVTHQHTQKTLIRRPLHGRGEVTPKDSYIEYSSECTVITKHPDNGFSWNTHLVVAVALIFAICLVSLVLSFFQLSGLKGTGAHSKSNITSEMFLQAFNSVKESFRVQTSGFWGVIRAAIKPIVLQENPDQPAVFVLVVPSDTHETAACFTRLFSSAVTGLFRTKPAVEFLTDAVTSLSPARVKRLLDDQLRDCLLYTSDAADE